MFRIVDLPLGSVDLRQGRTGFLWTPMETYGILWNPMDSSGFLWIPMESYGILWNPKGSYSKA